MEPKVLIGCPVSKHHEYSTEAYIEHLKKLDYPNHNILLVDNSDTDEFYNKFKDRINIARAGQQFQSIKKKITYCRNVLRKKVLDENYDYFFSVEQDVLVPADALKQLMSHNKDIVSGVYYNHLQRDGRELKLPIAYGWFNEKQQNAILQDKDLLKQKNPKLYDTLVKENWNFQNIRRQLTEDEVSSNKLMEVKMCGVGCMLIRKSVLEKVEFRENPDGFDDVVFCKDVAEKLKLKIYLDTAVKCEHLVKEKPWRWATDGKEFFVTYKNNFNGS